MTIETRLYLVNEYGASEYFLRGGTFSASYARIQALGSEDTLFRQYGGTSNIDELDIGRTTSREGDASPESRYWLRGGTLNSDTVYLGGDSSGYSSPSARFEHTRGTHNNTTKLIVGFLDGESGLYELSGGTLRGPRLIIGYRDGAEGFFEQDGGQLDVSGVIIGGDAGSKGTYRLSSGGFMASNLSVGNEGYGRFVQTGGAADADNIEIGSALGSDGNYRIEEGSLTVNGILSVGYFEAGSFNQNGGAVVADSLKVARSVGGAGSYYVLNGGSLETRSVEIGAALFGNTGSGSFSHRRGTHTVDSLLIVDGAYGLGGGTLNVQNVLNSQSGTSTLSVNGGRLNLTDTSIDVDNFNVGGALYTTGNFTLASGKTLVTDKLTVGGEGAGTLNQSGNITTDTLTVGYYNNLDHHYNLQEGNLVAQDEIIGRVAHDTTFTQSGGTNTTENLWLGRYGGNISQYQQGDGITTIRNNLSIGRHGTGSYVLSGGTLNVGSISNGDGTSFLAVNGGLLNLTGASIDVDFFSIGSSDGAGTFTLENGKSFTAHTESISQGAFTQNGGINTTNTLTFLSDGLGTYDLKGGVLNVNTITDNSSLGIFDVNGGTLNLTGSTIDVLRFNVARSLGTSGSFTLDIGKTLTAAMIEVGSQGTLTNHGTLTHHSSLINRGLLQNYAGGTLTNTATMINSGTLNNNYGGTLTNKSTRLLTNNGILNNTYEGTILNHGHLDNRGTLTNIDGGLISNDGTLINSGAVMLSYGSRLEGPGTYRQTEGTLIVNGTLTQSRVDIEGGTVGGRGTINSDVTLSGAELGPGNSPGILTINGDFAMDELSTLSFELGGTTPDYPGYDVLNVSGSATLAGELELILYDDFEAQLGDSFDLLSAASLSGDFDLLTLALLGDGLGWETQLLIDVDAWGTDVLRVSVSQVPIPAAAWLFGSALIGLVGIKRKRRGRIRSSSA
ncbi:VPLPA-CTERM sorting domain-containing protein [Halieaceae bacterium IMCC14734]|uniref:VPLPA-CTERM sorting domain-containing protein n=1 Tax=Candidatus Litorirhabdus singularis TaxID=2518993 RepID=A0ABT3TF01_9GAMM|nr:VPLPA-CTERM sorting domain-containing protein [Candidatus Litorirhabdus singularis]MCX2980868.1 VPLPA-CTERM sorting domain-containing protein [Candidatus Litorirhabdus singularis]